MPEVYNNPNVMKRTMACSRRCSGWAAVVSTTGALAIGCCGCATAAAGPDFNHWLALKLNARLPAVEQRLRDISSEMAGLPVLTDMDALGSHGFHSNFTGDSEGNWFEITWDEPRSIDGIALMPTRLTTQSGDTSNYGFPNRIRVEAMVPGGTQPVVIAELTRQPPRFPPRGSGVFRNSAHRGAVAAFHPDRPAETSGETGSLFLVVRAHGVSRGTEHRPRGGSILSAPFSIDAEVGWNIRYLTDGQSPLGPARGAARRAQSWLARGHRGNRHVVNLGGHRPGCGSPGRCGAHHRRPRGFAGQRPGLRVSREFQHRGQAGRRPGRLGNSLGQRRGTVFRIRATIPSSCVFPGPPHAM